MISNFLIHSKCLSIYLRQLNKLNKIRNQKPNCMRKIFLSIAVLIISLNLTAQTTISETKTLSEGTIITVKLLKEISSASSNTGDIIEFETTEPVTVGDHVLIAKGLKVTGKITEAEKRKGLGKAGKLSFSIDYLQLPSGKNVKLTTEVKGKGTAKVGAAVAQAVLLTPLFLLKKGKTIVFKEGDIFKAFVSKDTEIN